jgi:hypothetical protein
MDKDEKRQNARRAISHTVHLVTGLGPPLKCRMEDVSKSGARIAVSDPRMAPQKFLILLNKGLLRWCEVMWRSEHEIGIKFIRTPHSLKTRKAKASRAKKANSASE